MSICYLCGKILVDRPNNFHKNHMKDTMYTIKHKEHIIHNALYGRLTFENILCENCGKKLAVSIDSDFCKLFQPFTEMLRPISISKEHGRNKLNQLPAYLFNEKIGMINVKYIDGKILPLKPYYFQSRKDKKLFIFCDKKTSKNYKDYVINKLELDATFNKNEYEVVLIDDLSFYGNVFYPFSAEVVDFNKKLRLGLNKIAAGFAIGKGVSREDIPRTLDITNGEIIYTSNIVFSYPVSRIEYYMEYLRPILENDYPTHTLILYTEKVMTQKRLVCYIDLFSTFQFYIILNDNFCGNDIHEIYYQTIAKKDKAIIDIRNTGLDELDLVIAELKISKNEIKGKNIDEIYDYLEKKYNQSTVNYKLDFDQHLFRMGEIILEDMKIKLTNESNSYLQEGEQEIIDTIFETKDLEVIYREFYWIKKNKSLNYRINYLKKDLENYKLSSTLSEVMRMIKENSNKLQSYGYLKFNQLSRFIQKITAKE